MSFFTESPSTSIRYAIFILCAAESGTIGLSTALAVTGLPATAFFDADGKLVDVHQGAYTADELRAAIEQHLPALVPEGTSP